MVWIDYGIITIIGFSAVLSLIRGFVREALSLITWGCAFFVASHFYSYLTVWITWFDDELIRNGIAVTVLFIVILITGAMVNSVIASLVGRTGLSGTDRVLGGCFGLLRGALIVAVILFSLENFTTFSRDSAFRESRLIPHFNKATRFFFACLQPVPEFPAGWFSCFTAPA